MAQTQSPGIITREIVNVPTVIGSGTTLPCFVGGATKGPPNAPTLVTSESKLVRVFGPPTADDYGLLAAIEYLQQGGQCFYLRVVDANAAHSASEVLGPEGVAATGSVTLTGNPLDGDNVVISDGATPLTFEFDIATAATGSLVFSGQPADGDTVILNDGVNAATTFEYDTAAYATGTLVLAGQPADADTFVVSDGSVAVTFEFDSDSSVVEGPTLRQVVIGATVGDTLTNLQNAINNAGFTFAITAGAPTGGDTVPLTNDNLGTAGNQAITEPVNVSGNLSSTGMLGGDDLTVTGGNVGVVIGATAEESRDNLLQAINAIGAGLLITGTANGTDTIDLANDNVGVAGNVAITNSLTNVAETGMSGGADAGVGGGNIAVAVGASAAATALNLRNAINAQSFDVSASISGATVLLTNTVLNGASGNVAITESDAGANITVLGMANGSNAGSLSGLTISAATPGTWGDDVVVVIGPTTVSGAPLANFDITVRAPVGTAGVLQTVESFKNLSADSSSTRFAESIVNEGRVNENAASSYIRVSVALNQTPIAGTYTLGVATAGNDGISALVASDYIGSFSGQAASGMQTLRNAETISFNLLAIPGVTDAEIIQAGLDICEFRQDALYVVDPPFGLTVDEVVDWHNGVSALVPNAPTAPLDSSFGALYWSWVRTESSYLGQNIWLPPSGFVLAAYALTDKRDGPWVAPAGFQRGQIAADAIEISPFQEERDKMLLSGNAVNPIVSFGGNTGFIIFGNDTLQRTAGPLDAVHVRRMLIYLKAASIAATRDVQFEPNNEKTWRNIELKIQPIIDFLVARSGVKTLNNDGTRPRVKCDADTNPAELQANKTLNAKIFVSHIDAAETLELDFTLIASGVGSLTT